MYYLSVYPFVAALPLQSGDEGLDEDESAHKPSKSQSERSSKRKKIPKQEKRKTPRALEATLDETQEIATVSPFFSITTLQILETGLNPYFDLQPEYFPTAAEGTTTTEAPKAQENRKKRKQEI